MTAPLSFDNIRVGDILIWKTSNSKYKILAKRQRPRGYYYNIQSLSCGAIYHDYRYSNEELNRLWELEPRPDKELNILDYI